MAGNVSTGHTREEPPVSQSANQPITVTPSSGGGAPHRTAEAELIAADSEALGHDLAELNAACWCAGIDAQPVAGITCAALSLGADAAEFWAKAKEVMKDADLIEAVEEFGAMCSAMLRTVSDLCRQHSADLTAASRIARDKEANPVARRLAAATAGDCESAGEILTEIAARLRCARMALSTVPGDLADYFEIAYALRARGHKIPTDGDWLTGAGMAVNV